jgi:hypothetical protein
VFAPFPPQFGHFFSIIRQGGDNPFLIRPLANKGVSGFEHVGLLQLLKGLSNAEYNPRNPA